MQQGERKRLYVVEVPQPQAWALMMGNVNVVNLSAAPAGLVGHYLAICAGGGYDDLPARWRVHTGPDRVAESAAAWSPPGPDDEALQYKAIVAVAQVVAVGPPPPNVEGRWYTGPAGVWLGSPVRFFEPVPCFTAEEEAQPLHASLLDVVRWRFRVSFLMMYGQPSVSLEQLLRLPQEEQERVVRKDMEVLRAAYPETFQRVLGG